VGIVGLKWDIARGPKGPELTCPLIRHLTVLVGIQVRHRVLDQRDGGRRERLPVRWIRSSDGVYRPAPMACATPAALVMVAYRGKTFSSSIRCASSSPSEQRSPTTSNL
jgi:hypothetical protein